MSDITCREKVRVRTKSGNLKNPAQYEVCGATIEASSKIYLDVTKAEFDDEGYLIIDDMEFSHLNDEYKGLPCNVEGELWVGCTEGHEVAVRFGDTFLEALAAQALGEA